jgi:uncharacterized membrane protein
MNPAGQIVGNYTDLRGTHGFVRNPDGAITSFDPGSGYSRAVSINPVGQIAGYYFDKQMGVVHGFLRHRDGTITSFDPIGSMNTFSGAINERGEIVGNYWDYTGGEFGFVREPDGTITSFDAADSRRTTPGAINEAGEIIGVYLDPNADLFRSFLRKPDGTITSFNAGANSTFAHAISPRGQIMGVYYEQGNNGFVRERNGAMMSIHPPGSTESYPTRINRKGEITGYYSSSSGTHGFLRKPDGTILSIDPSGSRHTYPTAINSRGDIVGNYCDFNNRCHGFLRTK